VVEVRGTVHWLTHRDGPARALRLDPDARARLPRVLGETGLAVWVIDASGADALEVGAVAGQARTSTLADGRIGYVSELAASPDGAMVAAAAHDGALRVVDVASGQVSELALADDGPIEGLSWSPDSAWLVWSQPGPQPLRRIRIARMADREVIDVTDGRFADTDPVFTSDGLYLAFISRRSFDPVYDAQTFDMSFPLASRPYLVPLAAQTPSPFGPLPGGRPWDQDPSDADQEKSNSAERSVVSVDPEGLPSRVVGVPVAEARYSSLRAVKGGLAWLREPVAGVLGEGAANAGDDASRPTLERFDLVKREVDELAGELDWFDVSGDGTRLVIKDGEDLRVMPSEHCDERDSAEMVTVDLARARFQADPVALWRHAFAEAGRAMRRDFWNPEMSGVDWDGVLDAYRPLLDRIRGADDFTDLMWEMVAELGTSHCYIRKAGSEPGSDPAPAAVGQLGADISRDGSGRWLVDRVLPGESSDPRARSPLEAPGVLVRAGDELAAVDGRPVDSVRGPWPLLAGTIGKPVELTVLPRGDDPPQTPPAYGGAARPPVPPGPPFGGTSHPAPRQVVVVPLRDERRLRYQDWVAGRRRLVRERGEGRLGYLHVPNMVGEGWADFHRDLRTEMRFDALVMDVRGNGGGHISQLVLEKLARRVIAWDAWRGMRSVPYPEEGRRGPLVTLADEFAGSDGDIVTAAIKLLDLGPVVGTRTWGGVIGYDDYHELVDGTRMTMPSLAFWFEQYGWSVENYGVDPDVEVLISPDDWTAGRDPQLETAVRFALEALEKQPPSMAPDPSTGPVKARPPLPPRRPRGSGGSQGAA
jgi:tricorn protease